LALEIEEGIKNQLYGPSEREQKQDSIKCINGIEDNEHSMIECSSSYIDNLISVQKATSVNSEVHFSVPQQKKLI
jgi:hypothetical protein